MANSKKKGNVWENKLANWLRSHGFKAYKDPSSGSFYEKGDVSNDMGLTIESKAAKKVSLMEWWKQVDQAAAHQRNEPVLFIHIDGMPDNEWLVVQHSEDWIEARKGNSESEQNYQDPKAKYALQNLKEAVRVALKYLD